MREEKRKDLSRRRFLVQLAAGTGMVGGGLSACASVATFRAKLVEGRIVLPHDELEELIGVNPVVLVAAEGLPEAIVLIRNGGSYRALGARCTHLGCQVQPGKHALRCPCHGSVFDLEGNVIRGPAKKPLSRYPVEANATTIEIVVA